MTPLGSARVLLAAGVLIAACDDQAVELAPPTPVTVVVSPPALTLPAGASAQLAGQVDDATSHPIGGADLRFSSATPALVDVSSHGLVKATGPTGQGRVVVVSGGRQAIVPVTIVPGAPHTLARRSGDAQQGIVGTELANPLVVTLTDAKSNPIAGWPVELAAPEADAGAPEIVLTDSSGTASLRWRLGPTAAHQRVTVSARDLAAAVDFGADALAGPPATIAPNQELAASLPAATSVPVEVLVRDSDGNGVPGVEVTWAVVAGGGALSGPNSLTDDRGVAKTTWTLGKNLGRNQVNASVAGGAVPAAIVEVAAAAGPAVTIVKMSGDQQSGRVGRPTSRPVEVRVTDAHDNPVVDATVEFRSGSAANGALVEQVVTDAGGLAATSRWSLDRTGPDTLTARIVGSNASVEFTANGRR